MWKLTVVCRHRGIGRSRIINRMTWWGDDPELEEALRAGQEPKVAEMFILNDRFGWFSEWTNRQGRTTRYPNPEVSFTSWTDPHFNVPPRDPAAQLPDEGAAERAGALKHFRFQCEQCGTDRPIRQDRLDRLIRERLQQDPTLRALELDISDLLLS